MGDINEDRALFDRIARNLSRNDPVDAGARGFFRSLQAVFRSPKRASAEDLEDLAAKWRTPDFRVDPRDLEVDTVQDRIAKGSGAPDRQNQPARNSEGQGDVMAALGALARRERSEPTAERDSVPAYYGNKPARAGGLGNTGGAPGARTAGDDRVADPRQAGAPADGGATIHEFSRRLPADLAAANRRPESISPPAKPQGVPMDKTVTNTDAASAAGAAAVAASLDPATKPAAPPAALSVQSPGGESIVHRASAAMADVHGHTLNTLNALKGDIDVLIRTVEIHRERATTEISAFIAASDNALRHSEAIRKELALIGESVA